MKNPSLKSLLSEIGRILGVSPHALYVRQQALMRAGILDVLPGRGPGSGVVASPTSVATLLVSMLAATSLPDAPERTKALMDASWTESCPLTGKPRFGEALAAVISDPATAKRIVDVEAWQARQARIRFDGAPWTLGPDAYAKDPPKHSNFLAKNVAEKPLQIAVGITGDTIRAIADLVAALESEG